MKEEGIITAIKSWKNVIVNGLDETGSPIFTNCSRFENTKKYKFFDKTI